MNSFDSRSTYLLIQMLAISKAKNVSREFKTKEKDKCRKIVVLNLINSRNLEN